MITKRRRVAWSADAERVSDISPAGWKNPIYLHGVLVDGDELWAEYEAAYEKFCDVSRRLHKAIQWNAPFTDEERAIYEAAVRKADNKEQS